MLKAEETAITCVAVHNDEYYVAGHISDIQRLYDAGIALRSWSIGLDNGHHPYGVQKKRLTYTSDQSPQEDTKNSLTTRLSKAPGLVFAYNLHALSHTYLVRKSAAFWSEIQVVFADEDGRLRDIIPSEYYAIYCGAQSLDGNIRFVRLDTRMLV